MRERWIKLLIVAVPVVVTILVLIGRVVIETEAEKFEAELAACFEANDTSERCRVLKCLAQAGDDEARADCVASRGASLDGSKDAE